MGMFIGDQLAAKVRCPACQGEDVEDLVPPFLTRTSRKRGRSDGEAGGGSGHAQGGLRVSDC
jgi:hypothetical protein